MNRPITQRTVTSIHAAARPKASDRDKYPASACPPLLPFLQSHTLTMSYTLATPENEPKNDSALLTTSTPDHPLNHAPLPQLQQKDQHQRAYVIALVDVTVNAIATIWPNTANAPMQGCRPVAHLKQFLQHILKHSRTTHSTLQLAIFYLFRIRPRVNERRHNNAYVACGRRMFLAALICAHKFLQDKTYSNSAWAKVSGLSVEEVNHAERVMLQLLDWSLFVKKDIYDQWIKMLQTHLKCRIPPQPIDYARNKKKQPGSIPTTKDNNIPAIKTLLMCGMPTPHVDNGSLQPMATLVDNRRYSQGRLAPYPDEHQLHQREEPQQHKRKLLENGDDIPHEKKARHVV